MVYADVDGTIGWVAAGADAGAQGLGRPLAGARGKRRVRVAGLPRRRRICRRSFNPPSHFLATANHNILPPGYTHEIAYEWAPPYRFARSSSGWTAKKKFDLEDFKSIQHDNTSLPGQALVRLSRQVDMQGPATRSLTSSCSPAGTACCRATRRPGRCTPSGCRSCSTAFYRPHVPARVACGFVRDGAASR